MPLRFGNFLRLYVLLWLINNVVYWRQPAYQHHPLPAGRYVRAWLQPTDTLWVKTHWTPPAPKSPKKTDRKRGAGLRLGKLKATVYHAVAAQCDGNPLETADGSRIVRSRIPELRWCAVSQDLLHHKGGPLRYGDTVKVSNAGKLSGRWVVRDAMNRRHRRRIDFLVRPKDKFDPDQGTVTVERVVPITARDQETR